MIVSSDHQNRSSLAFDGKQDSRVPFLLKMAGQQTTLAYDQPLHTVATKGLIEAILRRELAGPEDAARWLAEHAR